MWLNHLISRFSMGQWSRTPGLVASIGEARRRSGSGLIWVDDDGEWTIINLYVTCTFARNDLATELFLSE